MKIDLDWALVLWSVAAWGVAACLALWFLCAVAEYVLWKAEIKRQKRAWDVARAAADAIARDVRERLWKRKHAK